MRETHEINILMMNILCCKWYREKDTPTGWNPDYIKQILILIKSNIFVNFVCFVVLELPGLGSLVQQGRQDPDPLAERC